MPPRDNSSLLWLASFHSAPAPPHLRLSLGLPCPSTSMALISASSDSRMRPAPLSALATLSHTSGLCGSSSSVVL